MMQASSKACRSRTASREHRSTASLVEPRQPLLATGLALVAQDSAALLGLPHGPGLEARLQLFASGRYLRDARS